MKRIAEAFARAKREKRSAFMPFLTAGDPSLAITAKLIPALARAGADLLEIGIPFSDSIADGPTIQRANERSLAAGATVRGVLDAVASARKAGTEIPLLLMGSFNPVLRYGVAGLCRDAASAGADGLIVADLPPDQADELLEPARAHGLATVFLVAPTSTDARLRLVASASTGFLYAVSLTGVTGARAELPPDLEAFLARVRSNAKLPVAVGFGIATPEMARAVGRLADGVIVGSALVSRIHEAASAGKDPCEEAAAFVRSIREAL